MVTRAGIRLGNLVHEADSSRRSAKQTQPVLRSSLRRVPLKKKRATKRAWKTPRCLSRGCRQPQGPLARCPKHRDAHLDLLWGRRIRTDRCTVPHPFPCRGHIEANHGLDRIDKGTRWDLRNGLSGCHALNTYAHYHKRWWYDLFRSIVGEAVYADLKALADANADPDYEAIHAQLGCDICEEKAA